MPLVDSVAGNGGSGSWGYGRADFFVRASSFLKVKIESICYELGVRDYSCPVPFSVLRISFLLRRRLGDGSDFTEIIYRHDEDGGASYLYVYGDGGYGIGVYITV